MITVKITGAEQASAYLREQQKEIASRARSTMQRLVLEIQRTVMADKLSGQVLKNRTGNLRRATTEEVKQEGSTIKGIVGTDRTAPYGKVHELGLTVTARSRLGKLYQIRYPKRSYLRSTLAEYKDRIVEELRDAVVGELGK